MPANFDHLEPMTDGVEPIRADERQHRLEKARRLMADRGIDALVLEPGSSMVYFLGVQWGRSERMMAALIPARGEVTCICPAFEEARLRERLQADVGRLTPQLAYAALCDHTEFPFSICHHRGRESMTTASVIAEPLRGLLHVTRSSPCRNWPVAYRL